MYCMCLLATSDITSMAGSEIKIEDVEQVNYRTCYIGVYYWKKNCQKNVEYDKQMDGKEQC